MMHSWDLPLTLTVGGKSYGIRTDFRPCLDIMTAFNDANLDDAGKYQVMVDILYEETESLFKRSVASKEICELRNMINVGYLIMRQAMERKESRGLHYTIDYPHAKK